MRQGMATLRRSATWAACIRMGWASEFEKGLRPIHQGGRLKAKRNLAYMHYFGAGVRRDFRKAPAIFQETSEAELGKADYDLGRLYYRGQGVE